MLAERAERAGVRIDAGRVGELGELARSARTLADRLGGLVEVRPGRRRPLALPGGVAGDSPKATEFLLRAPGALVLVDGYNVAKLAWPDEELAVQRQRLLDVVDDVARRFGSEIAVVFDGADVVGSHSKRRRLVRVTYSPAGESADDVIRAEVDSTLPDPAGRRGHQRPGGAPRRRQGRGESHPQRQLPRGCPLSRSVVWHRPERAVCKRQNR